MGDLRLPVSRGVDPRVLVADNVVHDVEEEVGYHD